MDEAIRAMCVDPHAVLTDVKVTEQKQRFPTETKYATGKYATETIIDYRTFTDYSVCMTFRHDITKNNLTFCTVVNDLSDMEKLMNGNIKTKK